VLLIILSSRSPTARQLLTTRPTINPTVRIKPIHTRRRTTRPPPRLFPIPHRRDPNRRTRRTRPRHQLWLQRARMNPVCVQTFIDMFSLDHEVREGVGGCEHVGGGQGFVLREAPGVEFVDGEDAGDVFEVVFYVFEGHA